ncbi:MAG: OB-fold nucleic acid binding domain-containing protein [Nanoarchaeota archaeon]
MPEIRKRETAYKIRIGDLLKGNPIFDQTPAEPNTQITNSRLLYLELGDKKIIRINLIANVVDKFESQGEIKFANITVDDGSGQIRAKVFSDNLDKFENITQGDTIVIIGLIRSYNQELYILPEIIKKQDPKYLLIRKLEIEKSVSKVLTKEQRRELKSYRDDILELIKNSEDKGGIDKEEIIINFKEIKAETISQEIRKLLEEGMIYESRPGRVRYIG